MGDPSSLLTQIPTFRSPEPNQPIDDVANGYYRQILNFFLKMVIFPFLTILTPGDPPMKEWPNWIGLWGTLLWGPGHSLDPTPAQKLRPVHSEVLVLSWDTSMSFLVGGWLQFELLSFRIEARKERGREARAREGNCFPGELPACEWTSKRKEKSGSLALMSNSLSSKWLSVPPALSFR